MCPYIPIVIIKNNNNNNNKKNQYTILNIKRANTKNNVILIAIYVQA